MKKRIFEIIQIGNKTDFVSTAFDYGIIALILANIIVTFMLSFDELEAIFPVLQGIEAVTMIIFLLEYLLRIWTAHYLYPDKTSIKSKLRFLVSFNGIVDILTIVPYFLPLAFPSGAIAFRMFRVVRILRLFKITSSYDAFNVIVDVVKDKKDQLISSMFIIFILLIAASFCMYGIENSVQPDKFSNAFSGLWWGVSALLTVGYGDIYPITALGRIMAIVISFLGVLVVAIPTGIISAGFVEYYSKAKSKSQEEDNGIKMLIHFNHEYCDKKIKELELPSGLYISKLIRAEKEIAFNRETILKPEDYIILKGLV